MIHFHISICLSLSSSVFACHAYTWLRYLTRSRSLGSGSSGGGASGRSGVQENGRLARKSSKITKEWKLFPIEFRHILRKKLHTVAAASVLDWCARLRSSKRQRRLLDMSSAKASCPLIYCGSLCTEAALDWTLNCNSPRFTRPNTNENFSVCACVCTVDSNYVIHSL